MQKIALYHYTAPTRSHLDSILSDGFIRPTESNITLARDHAGPDVVWAIDRSIRPGEHHGLLYEPEGKWARSTGMHVMGNVKQQARIEFAVPLDEAHQWVEWAPQQEAFDQRSFEVLIKVGGGMEQAKRWYVVARPVPLREWITVDNYRTGEHWTTNPLTGRLDKFVA